MMSPTLISETLHCLDIIISCRRGLWGFLRSEDGARLHLERFVYCVRTWPSAPMQCSVLLLLLLLLVVYVHCHVHACY